MEEGELVEEKNGEEEDLDDWDFRDLYVGNCDNDKTGSTTAEIRRESSGQEDNRRMSNAQQEEAARADEARRADSPIFRFVASPVAPPVLPANFDDDNDDAQPIPPPPVPPSSLAPVPPLTTKHSSMVANQTAEQQQNQSGNEESGVGQQQECELAEALIRG